MQRFFTQEDDEDQTKRKQRQIEDHLHNFSDELNAGGGCHRNASCSGIEVLLYVKNVILI
jgi:hypothetical protein